VPDQVRPRWAQSVIWHRRRRRRLTKAQASKAAVGMAKLGNDEHARNGDEIWVGGHAGTGRGEAR